MPKKMKRKALLSALSDKYKEKEVLVLRDLNFKEAKTKEGAKFIKALDLKGKTLIVTKEIENKEKLVLRNLSGVDLSRASDLNTYKIVDTKQVLFTKEAVESLTNLLSAK
ncbi:MAG TPA: 50S ribosomal protein L4, partial [Candidatus Saccharimonadales bacterium]|nr:50S ribosomal protein L4 [Candidatus Saccharimonadales bacterium]